MGLAIYLVVWIKCPKLVKNFFSISVKLLVWYSWLSAINQNWYLYWCPERVPRHLVLITSLPVWKVWTTRIVPMASWNIVLRSRWSRIGHKGVAGPTGGLAVIRDHYDRYHSLQLLVHYACFLPQQHSYMHIAGLVQDCSNSIANAMELLQSCTKPWYDKPCLKWSWVCIICWQWQEKSFGMGFMKPADKWRMNCKVGKHFYPDHG